MRNLRDRRKAAELAKALRRVGPLRSNSPLLDREAAAHAIIRAEPGAARCILRAIKTTGDSTAITAATELSRYRRRVKNQRKKR